MDTINKKYNKDQIELIKKTVAKSATDEELKMFIQVCEKYNLDPFIKEIWFIKRPIKIKQGNTWDYPRLENGQIDFSQTEALIMTSRDGYLKIAQRDENFDGIVGFVVHEGDTFEIDAENYKVTHKFGVKRGSIIGAWAKVDHKKRKPVIMYADFSEYYTDKNFTWKQYPSAMILKVAEVLALKRQFGISGLVTKEEMNLEDKDEELFNIDNNKTAKNFASLKQKKTLYTKAKESGLSDEEYKLICKKLFNENKISSDMSDYWTKLDVKTIETNLEA